jgi:hypothetical protein
VFLRDFYRIVNAFAAKKKLQFLPGSCILYPVR